MGRESVGAPTASEMTEALTTDISALVVGLTEGLIVRVAPRVGTAEPILTWGTLLGIPIIGALGSLFTRGTMGNLFTGMAAGGLGVLGFSVPAMVAPVEGPGRQIGPGRDVKMLPPGMSAPFRAQQAVAQVPRPLTYH